MAKKGTFAGEKNPMYGKHHDEAARKKMSEKVLKAYAEGRVKAISEYCNVLGRIAAARKRLENPELYSKKIASYLMWLTENTYKNEPSFLDDVSTLEDAFELDINEPQAKYWVALLQIDFEKVQRNLDNHQEKKALTSILHCINALVPPEAGKCYGTSYEDRFVHEYINQMAADYCTWMLENRAKLENYLVQVYAVNGKAKEQFLEILKRRFRYNWSDQKTEKSVKVETAEVKTDNKLEIEITEVNA